MSAAITLDAIKARCTEKGDCWLWTGAKVHGRPYIATVRNGKRVNLPAQKHALDAVDKGSPWGGPVKCRCDNDQCCNPAHLVQISHSCAWRFIGNPFGQLLALGGCNG